MSTDVSEIDKAIQAAQARKAAKGNANTPAAEKPAKPAKAAKAPRVTDEEKAAKQAAKDLERAAAKAARQEARAAKQLERQAAQKAPHMSKVEKAAARLPRLDTEAQEALNELTANFPAAVLGALALHLVHFNRAQATERALGQKVAVGDVVRIVSGDARYVGQTGTVTKSQRIRCYCSVEGVKKDVYLFTSDCVVITPAALAAKSA